MSSLFLLTKETVPKKQVCCSLGKEACRDCQTSSPKLGTFRESHWRAWTMLQWAKPGLFPVRMGLRLDNFDPNLSWAAPYFSQGYVSLLHECIAFRILIAVSFFVRIFLFGWVTCLSGAEWILRVCTFLQRRERNRKWGGREAVRWGVYGVLCISGMPG